VALIEAQKAGKPVVVSMGSYAASGGYWIAAPANKIFANNNTLTGSIGTFITFPTFKAAANGLGVYSDGVGTTTMSDLFNPLGEVPEVLDRILKQSVNLSYKRFLTVVSVGRDMTLEQVDTLAQGRVWVAQDALEHGLIDAIGNLDDAIDSAALLTELGNYDVLYIEQPLSTRERILQQILKGSSQAVYQMMGSSLRSHLKIIGKFETELETLLQMSQKPDIYLQCLDCNLSF
jgi:protease-4